MNRTKVLCNTCRIETFHDELFRGHIEYPHFHGDEFMVLESCEPTVLMCRGCHSATFALVWILDNDPRTAEMKLYPEREVRRLTPKAFANLPDQLSSVYKETLNAYNNGLSLLSAIGLRTLIEGVCEEQGVVPKQSSGYPSIEKKINGLKGRLPEELVNNLHAFRFMGNQATHELVAPPKEDLLLAINVIEDLMNYLYHLDYQASLLGTKQIPKEKRTGEDSD